MWEAVYIPHNGPVTETSNPLAFLSYSWDDADHRAWVLWLAGRLRADGVDVTLDEWDTEAGTDLGLFMERAGTDDYRVIAVISDRYRQKADEALGGVGFEKKMITPRLMRDMYGDTVIPVLRNTHTNLLPRFLGSAKYIDMREDVAVEGAYEDLLRALWRTPRTPKPVLGPNPFAQHGEDFVAAALRESAARYTWPAPQGQVTWPYTYNSGRFIIGSGEQAFTIQVSTAGHGSVHFLSDPADIRTVALAQAATGPQELDDPATYDGSSRARTVRVGDAAILRNENGYWAAVFVDTVTTRDTDPDGEPRMVFRYVIGTRPNTPPRSSSWC